MTKHLLQKKGPLIFSLLSLALIVLFSILKFQHWQKEIWQEAMLAAGAFVVGIYVLWIIIELKVARQESSMETTSLDRGTYEFYVLGRILTVFSALLLPTYWEVPSYWLPAGIVLLLAGISIRLFAIRALGQFYSHRVRLSGNQQIVKHGPYRVVRHPSYTGMLLAHAGFVIFFFNWITLAVYLVVFVPAVVHRILVEEKVLLTMEEYASYSKNKKRVIPFIW